MHALRVVLLTGWMVILAPSTGHAQEQATQRIALAPLSSLSGESTRELALVDTTIVRDRGPVCHVIPDAVHEQMKREQHLVPQAVEGGDRMTQAVTLFALLAVCSPFDTNRPRCQMCVRPWGRQRPGLQAIPGRDACQ